MAMEPRHVIDTLCSRAGWTNGGVQVRVQVVDDNATLRAVTCLEIELADDLQLVAEAADGAQAIAAARTHRPDVILLDVDMPVMNGLDALPELLAIVPNALIVVYTSDVSAATQAEAFRRGAGAFARKGNTPIRDLLAIVRQHRTIGSSPA